MDAQKTVTDTECIEVDTNQAYGINAVPTDCNVAYATSTTGDVQVPGNHNDCSY